MIGEISGQGRESCAALSKAGPLPVAVPNKQSSCLHRAHLQSDAAATAAERA